MAGIGLHRILADAAGIRGREVIPRVIPIANPAVGLEFSITVQPSTVWIVESIIATLVTSAVAGSRAPTLSLTDGTTEFARISGIDVAPASQTWVYSWLKNYGVGLRFSGTTTPVQPFPDIPLVGGWRINSITTAKDAGDQWSNIALYVLEIEETPYDIEVARDLARLAGSRVDSVPQIGSEY